MNRTEELRARQAKTNSLPARSARELMVAHVGANPYDSVDELEEIGRQRAKATALAYLMENKRKSVLASICSELAGIHAKQGLSEAKLERLARSDPRYITHIEATADAIEDRERLTTVYWAQDARIQWDKSAIAHLNKMSGLDG